MKYQLGQEVLVNVSLSGNPSWKKGRIKIREILRMGKEPKDPWYLVEHAKKQMIFRQEQDLRDLDE